MTSGMYIYGDPGNWAGLNVPIYDETWGWLAEKGMRIAEVDIAGGNVNAFAFNWQNPHAFKVIVLRIILDITTAGGVAAGELDCGVAAGTGVHSDNLIDGVDPDAIAIYDNIDDQGANGSSKQKVDENGGANDWVTCQILLQNEPNLDGKAYIIYTRVET